MSDAPYCPLSPARDEYASLALFASGEPQTAAAMQAAWALDAIDHLRQLRNDLGLRNRSLAQQRALIHRAAKRLLVAIDEDDDNVNVYLEAREALRRLVFP